MATRRCSAATPKQTSTSGSVRRRQWSAVWHFYIFKLHSWTWRTALRLPTLRFFSIVFISLSHRTITCQLPLLANFFSGSRLSDFCLEYDHWQMPGRRKQEWKSLEGKRLRVVEVQTSLLRFFDDGLPFGSHQPCLGSHSVLLQSGAAPLRCIWRDLICQGGACMYMYMRAGFSSSVSPSSCSCWHRVTNAKTGFLFLYLNEHQTNIFIFLIVSCSEIFNKGLLGIKSEKE